jgi:hypothetical protein
LTEACVERTIHGAVMESFAPPKPTEHQPPTGPMGISLASDAIPGSLVAFGLVPHRKEAERFFSSVNFSDPKMLLTATTIFTGVPVDRTTLLPEANYVPNLSLANFSAKELQIHVQYARTFGAAPTTNEIAALTVPAGSSKAIAFDNLQGDPQLQNSFLITSNGAPGFIYGLILGFGVFTRIPTGLFYALLIWVASSGDVQFGALAFLLVGLGRALPVTMLARETTDGGQMFRWSNVLHRWFPIMRLVNALVLSGAAGWFLAAELGK